MLLVWSKHGVDIRISLILLKDFITTAFMIALLSFLKV